MTFEQVFTYATLGLTALHKLVDVAELGQASRLLGFLPALRQGVKK